MLSAGYVQYITYVLVTVAFDADCVVVFPQCVHVNQETLNLVVAKAEVLKAIPVFGGPVAILLDPFQGFANVRTPIPT
jgi:NADH:ubiquinone oxidoreductase subunit 3 (subunit A)